MLPADPRAERAVLTAITLDAACWPTIASICEPADFSGDLADVARALWTLAEGREPIDVDTLTRALGPAGVRLSEQNVLGFMRDYVSVSAAPGHARRVRDVAAMRRVVTAAMDVVADAAKPWAMTDPAEFVEAAGHRMTEAGQVRDEHEAVHVGAVVRGVVAELKARKEGKHEGLSVEWPDLNKLLRGFRPGQLIVVAARPGVGKTAIALDLCRHLTRKPHVGHLFSLEMLKEELADRLVAAESYVRSSDIESGQLTGDQLTDVLGACRRLGEMALYIDDSSGLPIHVITARARAMAARRHTAFVVVDYLQLVRPSRRGHSRESEVAEISGALVSLAKDIKAPVICCAQLNREADNREPRISDLRESGAIEQDAHKIILLHRPDPNKTITKVIVGKNRRGPTGWCELDFHASRTTFKQPEHGADRR